MTTFCACTYIWSWSIMIVLKIKKVKLLCYGSYTNCASRCHVPCDHPNQLSNSYQTQICTIYIDIQWFSGKKVLIFVWYEVLISIIRFVLNDLIWRLISKLCSIKSKNLLNILIICLVYKLIIYTLCIMQHIWDTN